MGWTLASWICQRAREHVVDCHPAVDSALRCVDRRPLPKMVDYVHTQYVDNFVAISQKSGRARALAERPLNEHGLPTHAVESGVGLERLGWAFITPRCQSHTKGCGDCGWPLLNFYAKGAAMGRLWRGWWGTTLLRAFCQGLAVSVPGQLYCFIRKCYNTEMELWPEGKRELRWASFLLCLA